MNEARPHVLDPATGSDELMAGEVAERGDREDAGRVEVADRVIEKIAGHAVTLVRHAGAAPKRLLGVNVGEAGAESAASVSAEVQDGLASVRATIAVRWPNSVPDVADAVRRRIHDEVAAQTGVRVTHVDVDVVSMTFAEPPEPRVR